MKPFMITLRSLDLSSALRTVLSIDPVWVLRKLGNDKGLGLGSLKVLSFAKIGHVTINSTTARPLALKFVYALLGPLPNSHHFYMLVPQAIETKNKY
jgi:hypothetical protein